MCSFIHRHALVPVLVSICWPVISASPPKAKRQSAGHPSTLQPRPSSHSQQGRHTQSLRHTQQGQCDSDLLSLPIKSREGQSSYTRVVMADYPTVGAGWVKNLVEAAFATSGVAGNPACSIYGGEGNCTMSSDIHCRCNGFTSKQDVVLIKTHFPAQELYRHETCNDEQYANTLQFDKVLRVVRHPARIVEENADRFGGGVSQLATNLVCYTSWWNRVAESLGSENVMVVRYEDLCQQTADTLFGVLQFFGGSASTISKEALDKLSRNATLSCEYSADDLLKQSQWDVLRPEVDSAKKTIVDNSDLFKDWKYDLKASQALVAAHHRPKKSLRTAKKSVHTPERLDEPNPWASVW